jgi:hypothetical protein
MLAMSVITALCTAGVAFYLRFLSALWKEIKPGLIGFSRRFQFGFGGNIPAALSRSKAPKARELLRLIEVGPNATCEGLRKDVN